MAFYCMGSGLSSCKSDKESDPAPNGGNTNTKFELNLDLTSNDFKNLKTDGEFVVKDNLIIANNGGTYVAVAKACTHQGTTLTFNKSSKNFNCPNHGSNFSTAGAVVNGPATVALKVYKVEVLESGNKLKITE